MVHTCHEAFSPCGAQIPRGFLAVWCTHAMRLSCHVAHGEQKEQGRACQNGRWHVHMSQCTLHAFAVEPNKCAFMVVANECAPVGRPGCTGPPCSPAQAHPAAAQAHPAAAQAHPAALQPCTGPPCSCACAHVPTASRRLRPRARLLRKPERRRTGSMQRR